jgi:SAM-dependent methyltransferase
VSNNLDPRTDRGHLTTVAYGSGDLLADRQQLYRFVTPKQGPIAEWLFSLVDGNLPEPVVDIGVGNGQYLAALHGRPVIGVDLSRGMLEGIADRGWPLVEADAQALPLATRSVGTAMANHMLYHVPDIALAARELRRVVRPGGVMLAVTNGAGHMAEIGDVIMAAVTELGGDGFVLDRSGDRFTLEDGGEVLAAAFTLVERHDRHAEVLCPEADSILRYIASMRGLEPTLPNGLTWDEVVKAAEPRVGARLKAEGVFRVGVHVGAFVCR